MQFNKKFRVFGIILGVLVLAGLVGVMALTVQRAQQLTSTITRPKATDVPSWCTEEAPSCCKNIASGGGYDSCGGYELRGRCRPEQCSGSKNAPAPRCSDTTTCNRKMYGLNCPEGQCPYPASGDTPAECRAPNPSKSCACGHAYQSFCVTTCNIPQKPNTNTVTPMPSEQGVTLTPSFSWAYSTAPTGGTAYANVYMWSCQAQTDDCMVFGGTSAPSYDGIYITSFYKPTGKGANFAADWAADGYHVKNLKPNTPYWWQLTWGVTGCGVACNGGLPGVPEWPCQSWGFRTGAGVSPIPNCTNLTGPTTLTVGQAGTYTASHYSPQGNLRGTINVGQNLAAIATNYPGVTPSGNTGTSTLTWTPTAAGTYDVYCNSWNDAVAECDGNDVYAKANSYKPYTCAGPNSSMTVTVSAVASCVTANCPDNQACVQPNNVCLPVICLPIPNQPCKTNTASNHTCVAGNVADGTACTSAGAGSTCQSGVCTAPPPECTTDSACSAEKKCESNKCVAISCTTADVCKTATVANHACVIANKADGTVCETGGKTCQSGVCTAPSCPSGQTLCSGTCKNLQTDSANCGACGNACASNQNCTNGTCVNTSCTIDPDCSGGNVCAFP